MAKDSDKLVWLDIAAGPAHETMTRLAEKTKTQLLFPFDQVQDVTTRSLKGNYTFRQALRIMLKDTGLEIARNRKGIVTVYLARDKSAVQKDTERGTLDRANGSQQGQGNPFQSSSRNIIEEITVTARKRLESIREVPFSIVARTSSSIFLSTSQNLTDLARGVSGLSFTDLGPGQSQIAIRGISAGQVVRDQPGVKEQVGIYLDESVISMALFTPDLDLFDLERVEVLRGPQGTLFGSGSLSGTLRYISHAPDVTERKLITELSSQILESGDVGTSLKMALNAPLVEGRSAFRAVGYYNNLPGYVDAVMPDGQKIKNVNDGRKYGGRLAFKIAASDRLVITPRIVFQKIETGGFPRVDIYNVLANPYTESRPKVSLAANEQYLQLREGLDDRFLLFDMLINNEFTNSALTAITSYIDRDITVTRDAGQLTHSILVQPTAFNLPGDIIDKEAPLIDKTRLRQFSQEIRLHSTDDSPLQYVVGGFYSQSDRKYGQTLQMDNFEEMTGLPTVSFLNVPDTLFYSRYNIDFKQVAFFGEVSYAFSPLLTISGGLRWFSFEERRHMLLDGLFSIPTDQNGLLAKTVSQGLTPRVILEYKAGDNIRLNAQIAKGFRLGGINGPLNQPLCSEEDFETFTEREFYKNEELWNYEVGLKTEFFGGRATFDAAVFYADIRDLQATIDAGSCSSRIIFNVPRARSFGVEAEFFIRPHPNLDIALSASVQNATIRSTLLAGGSTQNAVLDGIERGNRLPTSPRFQASAQFNYFWDVSTNWNGFAALSLYYVGSSYSQIRDQVPEFGTVDLTITDLGNPSVDQFNFDPELPGYGSGNIRIGLKQDHMEFSVYINNLWNKTIRTSIDRERGGLARVGYTLSPPRSFGFTMRSDF